MSDICDCPASHPTEGGRCVNPSLSGEDPEGLARYSECGCCMADCPDVHPEPVGLEFVPGSAVIAAEYVATMPPDAQQELREAEARGELRIATQAEMRREIGIDSDESEP